MHKCGKEILGVGVLASLERWFLAKDTYLEHALHPCCRLELGPDNKGK